MAFGRRGSSKVLICSAGTLLILLFWLGLEPLATLPLRRALRNIDPDASIRRAAFSGDLIVVEGLAMPGRDLFLDQCVIYWSGGIFSPCLDSVLVLGGRWIPGTGAGSSAGSSGGRRLPPCRFAGILVMDAGDSTMTSGTLFEDSLGRTVSLMAQGSWGSMEGSLIMMDHRDSALVSWFELSSVPGGRITIPHLLSGARLQGSMTAVRTDHVEARGVITSIDGENAEVTFRFDDHGGTPSVVLSSRLEDLGDVITSGARSLMGGTWVDLRPSGTFTLEVLDSDTVTMEVEALLDTLSIYSPGLADDTVRTSVYLEMTGEFCPSTGTVSVDPGLIRIGELPVDFTLRGRFSGPPRIEVEIWSDSVDGDKLASSVPSQLLGPLDGLEMSGSGSFRLDLVLDWGCPDSCDFQAEADVSGLRVDRSPIQVGQLRDGGSCLMRDSWGGRRTVYLDTLHNEDFMVLDSLHPAFEGLLRCAEDATFRSHSGFCEYHVRNSLIANMRTGRFTRGGSTISMQLARNLFLGREKTLARKVQEVFLTWRLEVYLTKDRMLEIYANIVELGPGVFGFQEAALYYFGSDFRHLTTRQVAYLVSILPGPRLYHRFFTGGSPPGYWEDYLDRLVRISMDRGWIDPDSARRALADSITFRPSEGVF